ncbi:MAG TPA: ABC transporter permease [Gemmatimonadaceae bacterium]
MARIPGLRRILRAADARSGASASAIDDELRFHIESRVDELVARGTPEAEARLIAQRDFGDWNRYRADVLTIDHHYAREIRMRDFVDSVLNDSRHAVRMLRNQPAFTAVSVVTLALGIAATTTVFSAVNGVLLRPLPYADANRIVHIGEREIARSEPGGTTSYDNFADWQRLARSFTTMGIVATSAPTLTGRGDPVRVPVALVSAEMFDVFHVKPSLGRGIVPSDNVASAPPVLVLDYDLWRTRFGGDPTVIGQTVALNFVSAKVVGVLPRGFIGTGRMNRQIWSNFVNDTSDGRTGRSKDVYALLRPGVTLEQAQAEMAQISKQLEASYPQADKGETAVVDRLVDRIVGDVRRPLILLLAASLLVLLIACANLSNLLLARGMSRRRELAVRVAVGAGRGRIVRQLLTESLLLAAIGCVAGVLVARLAMSSLAALGPPVFASRPPELDLRVLLTAMTVSVATTLLFGLLPALRIAPREPQAALRESGARVTGGAGKTRTTLATAQLSLAVILLSASALVVKSFVRVLEVDSGIRSDHLLTMQITLPRARYDSSRSTIFYDQLARRLRAVPGVRSVAFTSLVPFSGDFDRIGITKIAGEAERVGADAARGDRYVVSPSYFATMGIRLLRGRIPTEEDRFDAPLVCVVDEVFAKRIFGDRDPIGRRMDLPARDGYATIVGVVSHVKTYGLDVASPGQIYMSDVQYPWRWSALVVRTTGDPLAFASVATHAVHELDADQPVDDINSMDRLMSSLLRARRFTLTVLSAFAAVAIVLAVVGLYGVIAYGATQRRREFSVRIALGAQRRQIARIVVGEGARIAVAGVLIGIVGALATARLLSSLLFDVDPHDAGVLSAVVAGLSVVAMMACVVPARRATRVDAAEVLRGD